MIGALCILLAAQTRPIAGFDFSLYRPAIDAGLHGETPYRDLFGTGRVPLLGGHAGALFTLGRDVSLSLALSVSHFSVSAKAFVDDGDTMNPASTTKRSGGETSLSFIPVAVVLGARYTGLFKRFHVPLIFYGEAGPACAPWTIARGGGETAAEGATWGLSLGTGIMLELTGFDDRSQKALADEFGVQSVAARAGLVHLRLDGFGSTSALPLSDTTWSLGLELGF